MKQFIFFPFRLIVPKNLKTGFNIIEDWAFNADLSPEEIEKERGVVLEEYRIGLGKKNAQSLFT
jgi:zinc protease